MEGVQEDKCGWSSCAAGSTGLVNSDCCVMFHVNREVVRSMSAIVFK